MSRTRFAATALVGLLAVLAACTPTTPPAPTATSPTQPSRAQVLWTAKAKLVGWPAVAGETVVSYLQGPRGLQIAAWDVTTGAQLWRTRADAGHQATGVMIDADVVQAAGRAYVAFLIPGPATGWQRLVVADVRTGKHRKLNWSYFWATSRPTACRDERSFCLTGYRIIDDDDLAFRVDSATGKVTRDRTTGLPANTTLLGEHVFATDDRAPDGVEQLGWAEGGAVTWRRPYAEVFGPSSTSDSGWDWDDEDGRDVVVGTGWREDPHGEDLEATVETTRDATLVRTVGLDRKTGRTLWSLDGVDRCAFAELRGEAGEPAVLCRIKAGTQHWERTGSGIDYTETGYDVEVIGIDVVSGAQVWSVPIGGDGFDFTEGDHWFAPREDIVVPRAGGAIRIDRSTGAVSEVPANDVLVCLADLPPFVRTMDGDVERHQVGAAVLPCDASRTKLDHWTAESIESVGRDAGDNRWIVPTVDGLVALRT